MTGYIYKWNERRFMERNKTSLIVGASWSDYPWETWIKVRLADGGRFTLSEAFLACHAGNKLTNLNWVGDAS